MGMAAMLVAGFSAGLFGPVPRRALRKRGGLPFAGAFEVIEALFQLGDASLQRFDEAIALNAPRAWRSVHPAMPREIWAVQLRGKLPMLRLFHR
jgi:hypothetical protein